MNYQREGAGHVRNPSNRGVCLREGNKGWCIGLASWNEGHNVRRSTTVDVELDGSTGNDTSRGIDGGTVRGLSQSTGNDREEDSK